MKKITILCMLFVATFSFAQQDDSSSSDSELRPFRIGLKFGVPNLASLELEYVTPLLNNRVAPFVNYTGYKHPVENTTASLSTFEIGSNIYISKNNEGKGLYGAVSYQSVKASLDILDYSPENNNPTGTIKYDGTSTAKVEYSAVNVKLGAKLGRKFFFRTELGYSFGSLPDEVVIDGTLNGQKVEDRINIEDKLKDVPVISKNGMPIFNIGFGFAF